MLIKIRNDHFKIVKTSLGGFPLNFPKWDGFEVEETNSYYIVTGSKPILFDLMYHFSKYFDIELL